MLTFLPEMAEMNAGAGIQDGNTVIPIQFDPESPYAFEPPDYNSLPKDPPLYGEVFGSESEQAPVPEDQTGTEGTPSQANEAQETTPRANSTIASSQGIDNSAYVEEKSHSATLPPVEEASPQTRIRSESGATTSSPRDAANAVAALRHGKHKGKTQPLPKAETHENEPAPEYDTCGDTEDHRQPTGSQSPVSQTAVDIEPITSPNDVTSSSDASCHSVTTTAV